MTCTATRSKIARCDVVELYDVMVPVFDAYDWEDIEFDVENRTMTARLEEVWTSGTEIIEVTFFAEVIWSERESGVFEILLTVSDVSNKWTIGQCEDKATELLSGINEEFATRWHPYRNLIRPAQIQQSSS